MSSGPELAVQILAVLSLAHREMVAIVGGPGCWFGSFLPSELKAEDGRYIRLPLPRLPPLACWMSGMKTVKKVRSKILSLPFRSWSTVRSMYRNVRR